MSWDDGRRKARLPVHWPRLRVEVLVRDGYLCRIRYEGCLYIANEVDHVIAGDDHSMFNLQAACGPCHRAKSSREANASWSAKRAKGKHPGEPHPGARGR